MKRAGIDTTAWDGWWAKWKDVIKTIPSMKEAVLQRAGDQLQDDVHRRITSSGVQDPHGRVQKWQQAHLGSRGGYTAVRSDSVEVTAGANGKQILNAGALTHYLTSGHKTRLPSGRATRYQVAAHMTRVRGYRFYADAAQAADKIAAEAADEFCRKLLGEMKG